MTRIARRAFFSFALALLAMPPAAQGSTAEGLALPRPDGCQAVGVTTLELHDARRARNLIVTLWYPAVAGKEKRAAYMDPRTADAVGEYWELQKGFERRVRVHARIHPAWAGGGPFPVVLLEHGSSMVPAAYTVLAESLASQGFVVVGTNHPPDSLIAVYADGHELRFTPYWPENADRHAQGVAIGEFAEKVLVADVRFVLDRLQGMDERPGFWRGHLDLSRIAIAGHSMGGTTAALAARMEPRILAAVNLDGSTYPGMNGDVRPIELHKPLLFLATREHASDPAVQVREFAGSASNNYYLVVGGADHMDFSDERLLASLFSRKPRPDKSFEQALRLAETTRSLVEEFLAKYLQGTPAPRLDGMVEIERK